METVVRRLTESSHPLFVTHHHADRDSLGAAIGLRETLGCGRVCTPDGVAASAASLLAATDTDPLTNPDLANYDLTVVVDAPSTERISPLDPPAPVVIDHHERRDLAARASPALIETDASATAELVGQLLLNSELPVPPTAALALLVGLFDDSGFLAAARPAAIETATRLVGRLGDRAGELPPLLQMEQSPDERRATALGTLRATGYRSEDSDTTVAVTRVGAYETSVCHALREADVDLAAVCSFQTDGLRVTTRGSERLSSMVNLGGDLLPALAAEFGGDGGGHEGAGTVQLHTRSLPDVEALILEIVTDRLGEDLSPVESR